MRPLEQKPLEFINSCNCAFDPTMLSAAMLWYSPGTLKSPRKVFMHGQYPAVSIYDEKIHVHRLIARYVTGLLPDKTVVHHRDHDKLNAMWANLEISDASVHASLHNKGKTLSHAHRQKIGEAGRKRAGIRMKRKYNIPAEDLQRMLDDGMSISAIAREYGCDWTVVKQRIRENTPATIEIL